MLPFADDQKAHAILNCGISETSFVQVHSLVRMNCKLDAICSQITNWMLLVTLKTKQRTNANIKWDMNFRTCSCGVSASASALLKPQCIRAKAAEDAIEAMAYETQLFSNQGVRRLREKSSSKIGDTIPPKTSHLPNHVSESGRAEMAAKYATKR